MYNTLVEVKTDIRFWNRINKTGQVEPIYLIGRPEFSYERDKHHLGQYLQKRVTMWNLTRILLGQIQRACLERSTLPICMRCSSTHWQGLLRAARPTFDASRRFRSAGINLIKTCCYFKVQQRQKSMQFVFTKLQMH